MSQIPPAVVLFDVDGTLIRTEGPSRHSLAFRSAFEKVYGQVCNFQPGMHGMTDMQIFIALSRELGVENGRIREMAEEACRTTVELYVTMDGGEGRYVALPGVRELLQTLEEQDVLLGLVTGNAPEIARDKLGSVGLADYFKFGAYGSEAEDRTALPPLAVERAEKLVGSRLDPGRVFIVGDTPRDVACALDNGLRAVAVGTGFVPEAELLKSGAEMVLPDLSDPSPLVKLVTESRSSALGAGRK